MKLLLHTLVPCPQLATALFWNTCFGKRDRGEEDSLGPSPAAASGDSAQNGHADQEDILSSSVHLKIQLLENGEELELDVFKYNDLREAIRTHLQIPQDAMIEAFFGGVDVTGSPFRSGMEDGAVVRVNIIFPQEIVYPNGDHYDGERNVFGQRHGRGTWTSRSGELYDGEWQNDQRHGQGFWGRPNGDQYKGGWRNGRFHGFGSRRWPSGHWYEGQWQNGQRHGHGIWSAPDGYRYEGEYQNDQKHGHGKVSLANGETYDGELEHDKFHGHGIWSGPDGERYEGEWQNDQTHGHGFFRRRNGHWYAGEWLRTGPGRCLVAKRILLRGARAVR